MKLLIKEEKFYKDSIPYVRKYFGNDEEHIVGILEAPEDDYIKPDSEPEPTETELIQAELLLNQQEIIIKQNEHDEVLAAILLGQQTV